MFIVSSLTLVALSFFVLVVTDDEVEPRFFPLMGLTSFPRAECAVDDLRFGTCLVFNDCITKGGLPTGTCPWNFAACCLFQMTCGGKVLYNNTHFVNPKFPGYDKIFLKRDCIVTVALSPDVCFLRLDFLEFNITQPDSSTGRCKQDSFRVPGKKKVPVICGENGGQHMYIYVWGMTSVQLAFKMDTECEFLRVWNIRIRYLLCTAPDRPCINCLQYFTEKTGWVRSFNFYYLAAPYDADEYWDPIPANASRLANQDYWICVRLQAEYCSIEWTPGVFDLSGDDQCPMAETGSACGKDYLFIPEATTVDGHESKVERFCGNRLNVKPSNTSVSIVSSFIPLQIRFVTSSRKAIANPNRGFCMSYKLLECPSDEEVYS